MKSRLALLAVPFLALACTDAEQATLIAPERSAIETGTLTSPGGDAAVVASVIDCVGETITGTKKADIIDCSGSPVGVTISGGGGDDIIHGGDGDDNINGGNHSDMLYGDDGNDILEGSHHNDTLDGGAGEDTLDGGAGTDVCDGGADTDVDEASASCETTSNVP